MKTLGNEGYSRQKISERLSITIAQVRHSLNANDLTPVKCLGRPPILSNAQVHELEAFVCSSSENRQMSFFELAHRMFPHFGVSERVIARGLKKRRYSRQVVSPKPALSQEIRRKRYEFCRDHLDWTKQQWMKALWTDETWVIDGRHTKCWVTQKVSIINKVS